MNNLYNDIKYKISTIFNTEPFEGGVSRFKIKIDRYDMKDSIDHKAYVNLKREYKDNLKEEITYIQHVNYVKETINDINFIVSTKKNIYIVTNTEENIKEYNLLVRRNNNRNIKYIISYEKNIDNLDMPYYNVNNIIINRYHVSRDNTNFILELRDITSNKETRYELEIYIENIESSNFKIVQDFIDEIHTIMYNTKIIYTYDEYRKIMDIYNNRLRSREKETFDSNVLYNPRNLRIDDLKYGGLIGFEYVENNETKTEIYSISYKADGVRRILITYNRDLWLVYPPNDANLVLKNSVPIEFDNYILDGELIPKPNRLDDSIDNEFWYIAFDCLYDPKDNYNIEYYDYLTRLNRSKTLRKISSNIIRIDTKNNPGEFKHLVDIGNANILHNAIMELEMTKNNLKYKTDGYIFTPINMPINDFKRVNPKTRLLTNYRDICKWKPITDLTIDFRLKNNKLWVSHKDGEIIFTGTFKFRYNQEFEKGTLDDGEIGEFKYTRDKFEFIRKRPDKIKPNNLNVAEDTWDLINRPITIKTLQGKSIELMSRYHNIVKRDLFDRCKFLKPKTLLDLGSGKGGDIGKWNDIFERVIAVEPNKEYIEEFKERIVNMLNQTNVNVIEPEDFNDNTYRRKCYQSNLRNDKVIIIHSGAEEYENIKKVQECFTGGPCDVTSAMLSLSFFWKDKSLLEKLYKTINKCTKDSGRFIFMTINGNCVDRAFKDEIYIDMLKEINITFVKKSDNEVYIDIPDSIVTDQTEYLTKITDLISNLKFEMREHNIANQQIFLLNRYELILTSLYSYGYFE